MQHSLTRMERAFLWSREHGGKVADVLVLAFLVYLLSGCNADFVPPARATDAKRVQAIPGVTRFDDDGVRCYVYNYYGIHCVRMK